MHADALISNLRLNGVLLYPAPLPPTCLLPLMFDGDCTPSRPHLYPFAACSFGLQYPAGYSGEKAECWHGIYDGVSERRPDAECQTENWYPRLNGEKAQFHGGASRNAIYALDPGPARYVGCFRDDGTKGFSKRMNNVNMEDCANLAIRAGSAL